MSYSTLHAIYRTVATPLREYRNGWGTGPVVWDYLSKNYLGLDGWSVIDPDGRLWKLAVDERVPLCLRACHVFTFDGAVIPPDKLQDMATLIADGAAFMRDDGRVNHFPAIAADLAALKLDRRAVGVGLNCTSVSDVWPREAKHWARKPWDCHAYITGATP